MALIDFGGTKEEVVTRKEYNFVDFLAAVGGITSSIMGVGYVLVKIYQRRLYYAYIIKRLFLVQNTIHKKHH